MLDGIRANAQSWGVKLAFGIIILVFVFWGICSYTGPKGYVATVIDMYHGNRIPKGIWLNGAEPAGKLSRSDT